MKVEDAEKIEFSNRFETKESIFIQRSDERDILVEKGKAERKAMMAELELIVSGLVRDSKVTINEMNLF